MSFKKNYGKISRAKNKGVCLASAFVYIAKSRSLLEESIVLFFNHLRGEVTLSRVVGSCVLRIYAH